MTDADLGNRLARYFAATQPTWRNVTVEGVSRIHGGASRETYRVRLRHQVGEAWASRGIILRRDPTGSLIETDRATEYNAYRAFHGTDVPVPEPLCLELDPRWLDRPFFVMEEIEGCEAGSPFGPSPYGPHAEAIGTQFWSILGAIARADIDAIGLSAHLPKPEEPWRRELDYWEGVIDQDELEPQPILRAAIRHLRRAPPPPPKRLSVVHGDYRRGNFLFDGSGRIRAILDWEMCHLGDPLEDVGWAIDPIWAEDDPGHPGGMIARDQALALWREASGEAIDPAALAWWELFAHVKGMAIWISSGQEYVAGSNQDPVLAFSSWICTDRHDRIIARKLRALEHSAA